MHALIVPVALAIFNLLVLYLYIRINDGKIMSLPSDVAQAFSPKRTTPDAALETEARLRNNPISTQGHLPPRTGRRYIVVGGVSI